MDGAALCRRMIPLHLSSSTPICQVVVRLLHPPAFPSLLGSFFLFSLLLASCWVGRHTVYPTDSHEPGLSLPPSLAWLENICTAAPCSVRWRPAGRFTSLSAYGPRHLLVCTQICLWQALVAAVYCCLSCHLFFLQLDLESLQVLIS